MQRIEYKCFQVLDDFPDKCVEKVNLCYDITPLQRLDSLRKNSMRRLEDVANNEVMPEEDARHFAKTKIQ